MIYLHSCYIIFVKLMPVLLKDYLGKVFFCKEYIYFQGFLYPTFVYIYFKNGRCKTRIPFNLIKIVKRSFLQITYALPVFFFTL